MAFHLGFELPKPLPAVLDADSEGLTPYEVTLIKKQIRKNSNVIDSFIRRLDLFVNQEQYPACEVFLEKIRRRLVLLMEENDTFRKLLWRHLQAQESLGTAK